MKTNNVVTRPADLNTHDEYSHSEPNQAQVKHVDLDLDVLFDKRIIAGTAVLALDRRFSGELVLDTRNLEIQGVDCSRDGRDFRAARFDLGKYDPILGAALSVHLPQEAAAVRIRYSTVPDASGLQWLDPSQTAGRQYAFLYTQSEATHARSWIPLQDTPRVRSTYSARVRRPANLRALMSACNNPAAYRDAGVKFVMPFRIPSYLFALAVGDLDWRELSVRTGVFAEKPVVERAARELDDMENMVRAAEELFGPYRWKRFDALVLPPSFPVGGMENPCLTFMTPTILAGDRSLISLIVHELAHSWSSNLVGNATWRHIWLNEGLTVYMDRRIVEKLYGGRRAEIEAALGFEELEQVLANSKPGAQVLAQLNGRDPNTGFSEVPYEKGALFLRTIEKSFGRRRFDRFLRGYLDHFAFQSVTTSQFVDYLEANLLSQDPEAAEKLSIDEWLHAAGIPHDAAYPVSEALAIVEERALRWLRGEISLKELGTSGWSTQEWLRFLTCISPGINAEKMAELDSEFHITDSGNAEIENHWLLMAIRNHYKPAFPRLEEFLTTVGRRKFLKPLYGELIKTPDGRRRALAIYQRAYPSYHPISRSAVEEILRREA